MVQHWSSVRYGRLLIRERQWIVVYHFGNRCLFSILAKGKLGTFTRKLSIKVFVFDHFHFSKGAANFSLSDANNIHKLVSIPGIFSSARSSPFIISQCETSVKSRDTIRAALHYLDWNISRGTQNIIYLARSKIPQILLSPKPCVSRF